jgi:hypothetical protein
MRKFWRRSGEEEVEHLLRANRAEPRQEFAAALLQRLEPKQSGFRPQRIGGRVLVATAVTVLAVGAGVAAGGTHVAGTSFSNLIRVGKAGFNAPSHTYNQPSHIYDPYHHHHHHHHFPGPGDHQYVVAVCHHLNNNVRPWVELYLPPRLAAFFVRFFPPDYIVGADGNPDTCPP